MLSDYRNLININTELIIVNSLLTKNLSLNIINPLINNNFNILLPLINYQNINLISKQGVFPFSTNEENRRDSVSSSESSNLFTNSENNDALFKEATNFINNKRFPSKRPRKENKDNIRKKIKRGFFNNALVRKLNCKLKNIGSPKYFEKFPQYFASDVNQQRNKEILNITLGEIFEKKELFTHENEKGLLNYSHNLKVVQSEEIKENEEFKKIFNKSFRKLYEEYVNSNEFKIDEINRLKEKNGEVYVKNYIYLAKHLIEFFSQ